MSCAAIPAAFYAPMKPPDHPRPSGDRAMARNLMAALEAAGFAPILASRLRSHDKPGDLTAQLAIRDAALAEVDLLIQRWRTLPPASRPRLWFTYHLYDRAPDWIGPRVAAALAIPYVVAEASLAPSRAAGPWALGHAAVIAALQQASAVFILNENDRACLLSVPEPEREDAQFLRMQDKCVTLPPFLTRLPAGRQSAPRQAGPVRLLAVAMLRHGDKLASLRVLAAALAQLGEAPFEAPWSLTIVGDGPARADVASLFAPFGARVTLAGAVLEPQALDDIYAAHDLLVWPAVNEAFGMALLEAQANACPVLAGDFGGVSGVVRQGASGWLVAARPLESLATRFAHRLEDLLAREAAAPGLLAEAGLAGASYIRDAHSLDSAAAILRRALTPLIEAGARRP